MKSVPVSPRQGTKGTAAACQERAQGQAALRWHRVRAGWQRQGHGLGASAGTRQLERHGRDGTGQGRGGTRQGWHRAQQALGMAALAPGRAALAPAVAVLSLGTAGSRGQGQAVLPI